MPTARRGAALAAALVLTLAAACGDQGPVPAPGVLSARVASPNGAEGAALLTVFGDGVVSVEEAGGRLFSRQHGGDSLRVVLFADQDGALHFRLAVADTTLRPEIALLEVAGPDDALRASLAGYEVELSATRPATDGGGR
ncbi:MAG: hypothetical protein ACE5GJ_06710 [Gemmatimonadota bacterium]